MLHPNPRTLLRRVVGVVVAVALAAVTLATPPGLRPADAQAPNPDVLLITIDDLAVWALDYLLSIDAVASEDPVPNFRRLQNDGVHFTQAYVTATVCNPSRVSQMTGLLPSATGVFDNGDKVEEHWRPVTEAYGVNTGQDPGLGEQIQTMYDVMASSYELAMVGKVAHNSTQQRNEPVDPRWQFTSDDVGVFGQSAVSDQLPVSGVVLSNGSPITEQAQLPNGERGGLGPQTDWGYVVDWPHDGAVERQFDPESLSNQVIRNNGAPVNEQELHDARIAAKAVELLPELDAGTRPFLLAVGFPNPHLPSYVPSRFLERYTNGLGSWNVPAFDLGESFSRSFPDVPNPDTNIIPVNPLDLDVVGNPTHRDAAIAHYLATVAFVDEQLGRVLGELDRLGTYNDTLIMLWSDHGQHIGHNDTYRKGYASTVSAHIPFIIKPHNDFSAPSGARHDGVASSIDIAPTLFEMTGVGTWSDGINRANGASLAAYVASPGSHSPGRIVYTQANNERFGRRAIGETRPYWWRVGLNGYSFAARTDTHVYIAHPAAPQADNQWPPAEELFRKETDGSETEILSRNQTASERLAMRHAAWLTSVRTTQLR